MESELSIIHANQSLQDMNRNNFLENDSSDKGIGERNSYWNALHIISIIFVSVVISSVWTLIPRENTIFYPDHWYEMLIAYIIGIQLRITANLIMEIVIFLKVKSFLSIRVFFELYFKVILTFVGPYCISYLIWTKLCGFNHPLPLVGQGCFLLSWTLYLIAVWFMFPITLRSNNDFRRKMKYYIGFCAWYIVIGVQFMILSIVYRKLPLSMQWIIAIIIPLLRSGNTKLLIKLVSKIAGRNDEMANVVLITSISCTYTLYIAIQITSATDITVYSLLGTRYILHIKSCFQIIQFHRKINTEDFDAGSNKIKKEKVALGLVINELTEALVPIVYGIGFATAFYGPNKQLFTGVKEIEDVKHFFFALFQMFAIDICAMISGVILLRIFACMNLFRECCKFLKRYWFILAMKITTAAVHWASLDINAGNDPKLQFRWIVDDGRQEMIWNTTYLTQGEKDGLLRNNIE